MPKPMNGLRRNQDASLHVHGQIKDRTVLNPHQRDQKYQVEMVQPRAARLVTGRYRNRSSVTEQICWTTLDGRPMNPEEENFYKSVHDLIAIPHSRYLIPASKKTRAAHSFKYQQYPRSTDCFKFSFFPITITA